MKTPQSPITPIKPTITLSYQLLAAMAFKYVRKLDHFKDVELYSKREINEMGDGTGGIVIGIIEDGDELQ